MNSIIENYNHSSAPKTHHFYPYADNGGTVAAIAGDDFVVIASDTRLTSGYNILDRDETKLFQISNETILGSTGCWCDVLSFTEMVKARMRMYEYDNNKKMSTDAVAQMISSLLYYKRFFPYYVSNLLVGFDKSGKGIVYHYDPVGSFDGGSCYTSGAAGALIQPLLDNQIEHKNQQNVEPAPLTVEGTVKMLKDVFCSATERCIEIGDGMDIRVVTKQGVKQERISLRCD